MVGIHAGRVAAPEVWVVVVEDQSVRDWSAQHFPCDAVGLPFGGLAVSAWADVAGPDPASVRLFVDAMPEPFGFCHIGFGAYVERFEFFASPVLEVVGVAERFGLGGLVAAVEGALRHYTIVVSGTVLSESGQ